MDVVGLAFAVFGHLLASVLYIWRRIPFSSAADAVDRSSIIENKDQLRQLWEKRIMADEQPQTANESLASNTGKGEASERHEKKVIVENGISTACNRSEESVNGDPGIHDSDAVDRAVTDHNHVGPISTSEVKEVLTNGTDLSIQTGETEHKDLPDGKQDQGEEKTSESVEEEMTAGKNEDASRDSSTAAEGALPKVSFSDDQSADKTGNQDKREIQDFVNKPERVATETENVVESESGTEEFSAEAKQVADDTEEQLDEPNTEAYYTSSFTFVCQKSQENEEEEEEQKWEEVEDAPEPQEISETNIAKEEKEVLEKEIESDEKLDVASAPDTIEVSQSSLIDAECLETSENVPEGETDADYSSEMPYERTMTGDFQETNDEAINISECQLADDKNEYEIDAGVYHDLNSTTDEEKYFPSRTESATPDSDAELKRLERPNHFAHLKRTGVQKTERPYDSGTTESKIAMEIREMREREEELRLMRERMQSPESSVSASSSPLLSPTPPKQKSSPSPQGNSASPEVGLGYRVSTVFGHKASSVPSPAEDEKKTYRSFNKESSVEKEIRIARNREEELRKEKGLPPREDDSYIKPSQVKSSQVRVFSKMNAPNTTKELATTKIQQEIEEQTLREMALREKGHIQTISQERTDSKVAKLKDLDVSVPECASPTSPNGHGGSFSDRSSKRSTPSPTSSTQGLIPPVPRPVSQNKGISMHKFIASKGKETTFIASRNGPSHPEQLADVSRSSLAMRKAKRTVSVESKIQQEILEMKLREEELRRRHNSSTEQSLLTSGENGTELGIPTDEVSDYLNGQEINGNDDIGPSSNSLIAQWEQIIQKAEGRA